MPNISYQVFLGSPFDANEYRAIVRRKLDDLRPALRGVGLVYDVVDWEGEFSPQITDELQLSINDQLVDQSDLGIVLIGNSIGTPTDRAESGSAEEVLRFLNRWKADQSCDLMLFFLSPIDDDAITAEQYASRKKFKSKAQSLNIKTQNFRDGNDLERQIDRFFSERLSSLAMKLHDYSNARKSDNKQNKENVEDQNQDGLLELNDRVGRRLGEIASIFERISEDIRDIGSKMSDKTNELTAVSAKGDTKSAKKIVNEVANEIENFSDRIAISSSKLPIIYDQVIQDTSLLESFFGKEIDQNADIASFVSAIYSLMGSSSTGMDSLNSMAQTIEEMPRLTTKLNRAKTRGSRGIRNLVDETETFVATMGEIAKKVSLEHEAYPSVQA